MLCGPWGFLPPKSCAAMTALARRLASRANRRKRVAARLYFAHVLIGELVPTLRSSPRAGFAGTCAMWLSRPRSDHQRGARHQQQGEHDLAKSALVERAVEPEPGPRAGEH